MSATSAREANAFEGAVAPLVPRLRAVARRLVADHALAEDAVQEALLRAYRFWDRRRGPDAWPWLRQVVVRECWRVLRRHSAESAWPGVHNDADALTPGPEERAILAEEYSDVRRALELMPAGYQRTLRLRHGHDLGESAIAAILGLPLGTVQWRLKRAHDHLRLVLTSRHTPPLAATLREVARAMEIRVTTVPTDAESLSKVPPDGDSTGHIQYEAVAPDQAMALMPGFRLPAAVLAAHPDLKYELGRRGPDAPRRVGELTNVSAHTAGDRDRLLIDYNPAVPASAGLHVHHFPGAEVGIDEDTQVGGRPGHWTEVDRHHHLWWRSKTGAGWHVRSALPPEEIRRVAEAIEAAADCGTS